MYFVPAQYYFPCNTFETYNTNKVTSTDNSQRSRFTKEEDELLKRLVNGQTQPKWSEIAQQLPNRTSRQCRERYNNYLRPNLVNGPWTKEEDETLKELYQRHGPKWSLISQSFNARSAVNVKNRYSTLLNQSSLKNNSNINVQNNFLNTTTSEKVIKEDPIKFSNETIDEFENSMESSPEPSQGDDLYDNMFSNFNNFDEMWSNEISTLPDFSIFA